MRRLLRDIAEGRELGDVTTLRDPDVMSQLEGRSRSARPRARTSCRSPARARSRRRRPARDALPHGLDAGAPPRGTSGTSRWCSRRTRCLGGEEALGNASSISATFSGAPRRGSSAQVREQRVVGLERLEAAGDQPLPVAVEDQRRRGERTAPSVFAVRFWISGGVPRERAARGRPRRPRRPRRRRSRRPARRPAGRTGPARRAGRRGPRGARRREVGGLERAERRHSSAGSRRRAATTVRQAGAVAETRVLTCEANGMP